MKKRVSVIINISVLALAGWFLYFMIKNHPEMTFTLNRYTVMMLAAFVALVLALHFLKMSRLFFIMLEQKIRPVRFIQIYARTAFVNFLIPYKLGEIYRFYCLADATKNPQVGLLSVLVDRFFDTCALLFLLIPLELTYAGRFSFITTLLIVFLTICVMIFAAFPSLYNYLNKFLILNTKSKNSTRALGILEDLNRWYCYLKSLLRGRVIILILLSVLAWLIEYFALVILSRAMGTVFILKDFTNYIHSIFYLSTEPISSFYIIASAVILGFIAVVFFVIMRMKKEEKRNG